MSLFDRIKEHAWEHWERGGQSHHNHLRRHVELQTQEKILRIEQRSIEQQLRILRLEHRGRPTPEQAELAKKLAENRARQEKLRLQEHLDQFRMGRGEGFDRYYRHIRVTRIFTILFNLTFWVLLFRFSGLGLGLTIVVAFFAMVSTGGAVSELLFQARIGRRILKPVENLRHGVQEIARGNYDVRVDDENGSEIASLITAFNDMARQLRAAQKLKQEYEENRKALIANISHDLKTPMTSILGYVETLAEQELPAEKTERYLKIIRGNTEYMNRLVDDLFTFSKLDLQRLELHPEEVRIRPFLWDMMEEFRLDLEEKRVSFSYADTMRADVIVRLDGKRFHQILSNLVSNAVRHGPKEGGVHIDARLSESGGHILVEIRDDGPGIPSESLPHIFERFYQVEAERPKSMEGTGLGLSIAKELTELHGGTISAENAEGGGARFTVSIPSVREAEEEA